MLFNSPWFFAVFLPVTVALYLAFRRTGLFAYANVFLVLTSFTFYTIWCPKNLIVLLSSIIINFAFAKWVAHYKKEEEERKAKLVLILAIAFNLCLLGFFKYANFFLENGRELGLFSGGVLHVVLPLGISFFTFQKIAYQVDNYKGLVSRELGPYAQFVSFFPQLIAGPIVHYREMMPQFERAAQKARNTVEDLQVGIFLFVVGLFKKVVIADTIAQVSSPIFDAAGRGATVDLVAGWLAALGFTAQLYYDFSGYCDMALGAARMFGIRLPPNFLSPYKALSISDFWQRWHMTLSRFLRDYLYIPLGGNRKGATRRYVNLMLTMLLGGLWHGAGWTFVFWGFLHGAYLSVNHGFRALTKGRRFVDTRSFRLMAWVLTMLAVVVAWVFFKAESFDAAARILAGMAGLNGAVISPSAANALGVGFSRLQSFGFTVSDGLVPAGDLLAGTTLIAIALAAAVTLPNVYEISRKFDPIYGSEKILSNRVSLTWRPSLTWNLVTAFLLALSLMTVFSAAPSEFLYFQF